MRCERLRRIYFKYIDGELPGRKARRVEEHVRNCSDCAVEAKSIERIHSLLRTAGQAEAPDAYWNTYWERLEKKLPDEPSPVTLMSRISGAFASMFRQPAVLAKAAVYILFLAFLVYTTPQHLVKVAPRFATSARTPSETADIKLGDSTFEFRRGENGAAIEEDEVLGRRVRSRVVAGAAELKQEGVLTEQAAQPDVMDKLQSDLKMGLAEAEEQPSEPTKKAKEITVAAAPARAKIAAAEPVQHNLPAKPASEDEYTVADNYFNNRQYPQAIEAYQNFIVANAVDHRTLRAQFQIGEAYYQAGNYSDALSNFIAVTDQEKQKAFGIEAAGLREDKSTSLASSKIEAGKQIEEQKKSDSGVRGRQAGRGTVALYYDREKDEEIPKTREELVSLAVLRQAESYEHLESAKRR